MTTSDDHALARDLAEQAGRLLLELRAGGFTDPGRLRDEGDRRSHEFLAARLAECRPRDALLSEEGTDDRARLTADRVWIVDPLDGTREFGEEGRADWAVHVALWERGTQCERGTRGERGELTAGAVALPAQDTILSTLDPPDGIASAPASNLPGGRPLRGRPTVFSGGHPRTPVPPARPLRLAVSRSRPSRLVKDVAGALGAELVPCGSAGAKAATVITGETDAYLHSGGFYEWDTAAPVAVARAAGFAASRADGTDLRYNREDPLLPDILVCRPAIAELLLDAIREATHAH